MNKNTYTGSKLQNHFTAYLLEFIKGRRYAFLDRKIKRADTEELLENIEQMEARVVIEELLEERKLIYQHVFEERTFEEMSRLNGLSEDRCKGIYYYAIKKIRKMMGGRR